VVAPRATAAILFLAAVAACAARGGAAAAAEADVTASEMAVLNENCVACHVPAKHKGDLVLTSRETALKGGKDGPALVPGKAAESRLLKLVAPGGDPHMPPKGQLAAEDVAALRAWVEAGAAWDEAALTNASPAREVKFRPQPVAYNPVLALALSPDQKHLAVARGDHVAVLDLASSAAPVSTETALPPGPTYALAWSDDGKWLAAGGYRTVRVWDVAGSRVAVELKGLSGRANTVAFVPGSSVLVAGDGDASADGRVRQWSIPDGKPLRDWPAHADAVLALKVGRDGKLLVTGGADKLVKVWERETGKLVATLEGHASQVTALAINSDATRVASAGADKETKVWDLKTREKVASLPPHPAGVTTLEWLDGGKLLSACEDGTVRLGAFEKDGNGEGRFERTFAAAGDAVHCAVAAADGKTIYGGCHDGRVYGWSAANGAKEKTLLDASPASPPGDAVSFTNDVLPVLSKAGCNAGACHAKPAGQSGFKLSVFAYDPRSDHRAITKEVRGRRVFPAAPAESLLLKKPTMAVEHGGGLRLRTSSDAYRLLTRWIEQGMPFGREGEPKLVAVDVTPREGRYARNAAQPLRLTARYSDGSTRDVTALADFSSNEKTVATVDERGTVAVGDTPGEAVVVARYMGMVDVARVTVPPDERLPDAFYATLPAGNFIDRLVYERLKALGLAPSELCTDAEFLRRASLDAIGVLPTPEQARGFLADTDPQKREKLIDRLLAEPTYADHWANKWADLLRPNPFRAGVKSVYVLDQWLRESFRQNKPYDRFAREILTARGSTHRDGPVVVFRDRREPPDIATLFSQVFLGVRMECARCHHHPNEKWSQEDFYQLAAFFGQLKRKGQGISAPISGEAEFIWFAPGGEVKHPLTEQVMKPKAPDAPAEAIETSRDPREVLAWWMTRPDNPFFARAAVNRVWGELMGRGIVHPVDDFRASNPPTNPALLDALAKDFVDHGYDLKHLVRTMMRSRAYQLSSVPNSRNVADTRNFSRWYRRRPAAEVLLDAVSDVTGVRETLQGSPADGRAVRAWNYRIDSDFLDAFSRPNASADPPCERDASGSVVQALHLMNSTKLAGKLSEKSGRAAALAASPRSPREIVTELYLAAYCRYPTDDEATAAVQAFGEPGATRQSATEDVMWALLNSAEFVFNH
jgi:WD40 repeat protein/mono/diheme cytochrome c family protein